MSDPQKSLAPSTATNTVAVASVNGVTIGSQFEAMVKKAEIKLGELVESGEKDLIAIYDKVEPIVVEEGEQFAEALFDIALGAVIKQVPLVLAGSEKFGNAVVGVIQTVEIQGKTIAPQDAQDAVNKAFTALGVAKANLTVAAQPTA